MAKPTTAALKDVTVDKAAFDTIMRALIASPPVRKDDLKPKRRVGAKTRKRADK